MSHLLVHGQRPTLDVEGPGPEGGVMAGDRDPAAVGRLEDVLGDELLAVVDAELALQGQADGDQAARQIGGDAVAIAADLDVGIPADLAALPVRRVVAPGRQRPERRGLSGEALRHDLWTVPCTRGRLPPAATAQLDGKPEAFKALWSHSPDVSILGALGGTRTWLD